MRLQAASPRSRRSRRHTGIAAAGVALAMIATLGCREDAGSPTGPEPVSAEGATLAAPLAFVQVSTGAFHSCGVTENGRAYCWGGNNAGQLGDGTIFGNTARTTPSAVIGGLRFRHVSAGYEHSCGLTTEDRVYCWGQNFFGQLGNGTQGSDHFQVATPAEILGGRRFRQVRAGYSHTCAITTARVAFCWGENLRGQVGDGTSGVNRDVPVRVLGDHGWAQLTGGGAHTCGVTQDHQLFCWGLNEHGQLGNGTTTSRTRPVPVSGGREFRQVEAGGEHTCAVSTSDLAYCWGRNFQGSLGDGTQADRLTPGAVAGSRRFANVSAGANHSCGVTLPGRGFCWGLNSQGQVGDGTLESRLKPVALAVPLALKAIVASNLIHTCGVTTANRAYCWGAGGLLGDGTRTLRAVPVPVVGPAS
jgi:alpha-tubulin suppressor-like RCC1 family protein